MKIKKLTASSFDEIMDCFLAAFQNYFVTMPTDRNHYRERWKASKADFNLSYGAYMDEKLVGFIIHSIDERFGVPTAYNSGTGVIPEYRGNGIIKSMYEYALKDLAQYNIEKSILEVITDNERAIRVYRGIGFEKSKRYRCFSGKIKVEQSEPFRLEEVDPENINWDKLPHQRFYSWDNQKESILASNYRFLQVVFDNRPESFFIIKPETGYVAQLDVLSRNENVWNRLFVAIQSVSPTIKVYNVDERLTEKITGIREVGLEHVIDQYEMELRIK